MMGARTAEREEFLADVITSAIEGGTGYWAAVHAYRWEGLPAAERYAVIGVEDEEDEKIEALAAKLGRKPTLSEAIEARAVYKLTCETIARGIGRIARGEIRINTALAKTIYAANRESDAGEIDAEGADAIVQAALFGELVYG